MGRAFSPDFYLKMLSLRLGQIDSVLPKGVKILAVSKGQSCSSIRALTNYGHLDFGESRFQEANRKIEQLNDVNQIRWHFIGRLQANKVRGVVRSFDFVHSVDSYSLAQRISRISGEEKKFPQIMLQVKLREDENKTGFSKEDLLRDWNKLRNLAYCKIIGLMTISPLELGLDQRLILFKECRELANQLDLIECSMGMSSDWKEAVKGGATWIRVGSALFGARS